MNDRFQTAAGNRSQSSDRQPSPSEITTVTARIGEIVFARREHTVRTVLGSCVGVALYDRQRLQGTLAHILLPDSTGHEGSPGKFVDTAIPEMLRMMRNEGSDISHLTARIAGGANMFELSNDTAIGEQNIKALDAALKLHNVTVRGQHCGGNQGRRMVFTPADGIVKIHIVGSDAIEI